MRLSRTASRTITHLVLFAFLALGLNPAYAGLVGTGAVVNAEQALLERDQLQRMLTRDDVRQQLSALGVDPAQARARVDSMTDAEIQALSGKLSELPAGGDALGVVVFVFLVLLLTDILGYTDIFPFVRKP